MSASGRQPRVAAPAPLKCAIDTVNRVPVAVIGVSVSAEPLSPKRIPDSPAVTGATDRSMVSVAGARKVSPSGCIRSAAMNVEPTGRSSTVVIGVTVMLVSLWSASGGTVRVNRVPFAAWALIASPAVPIVAVMDAPVSIWSVGAGTVPATVAVSVPLVAVTVAVPGRTPRVRPVASTTTVVVSALDHVMASPLIARLCWSSTVAVSCRVSPMRSDTLVADSWMDVGTGGVGGGGCVGDVSPPPQLNTTAQHDISAHSVVSFTWESPLVRQALPPDVAERAQGPVSQTRPDLPPRA